MIFLFYLIKKPLINKNLAYVGYKHGRKRQVEDLTICRLRFIIYKAKTPKPL